MNATINKPLAQTDAQATTTTTAPAYALLHFFTYASVIWKYIKKRMDWGKAEGYTWGKAISLGAELRRVLKAESYNDPNVSWALTHGDVVVIELYPWVIYVNTRTKQIIEIRQASARLFAFREKMALLEKLGNQYYTPAPELTEAEKQEMAARLEASKAAFTGTWSDGTSISIGD